jgi:hypothetical protein
VKVGPLTAGLCAEGWGVDNALRMAAESLHWGNVLQERRLFSVSWGGPNPPWPSLLLST